MKIRSKRVCTASVCFIISTLRLLYPLHQALDYIRTLEVLNGSSSVSILDFLRLRVSILVALLLRLMDLGFLFIDLRAVKTSLSEFLAATGPLLDLISKFLISTFLMSFSNFVLLIVSDLLANNPEMNFVLKKKNNWFLYTMV